MRAKAIAVAGVLTALIGVPGIAARAAPVLTVDTDQDTFDGTCADDCSIRDAIASIDPGGTVRLPAGFYDLSLAGSGGVGSGDLDLDDAITVVGVGSLGAFIDVFGLGDRVFDIAADATFDHLTLIGGSVVPAGGLVRVRAGATTITDSTLIGGVATRGGAVAVGDGAAARIARSWLSKNWADERGGAMFVRGTASVVRSTISEGQAGTGGGGGVWVTASGSLVVSDSTLSSNTAARGGGALHVRGTAVVRSSTVAENRAAVGGGILASTGAGVRLGSSILDGNVATVRGPACSRKVATEGHNVVDRARCGLAGPGDLVGVDPLLGTLRQNGGPTPTRAIHEGSPAIGNGGTSCSPVDQRGAPRDDCDTGAYEVVRCLGRPVTIVGTAGDDDLSGGLKHDVFLGRGGDDEFQGSVANDRACGGPGSDHLIGGPGEDRLAGGAGDDVLDGEGGKDLLIGGRGRDVCRGGPGRDVSRRC